MEALQIIDKERRVREYKSDPMIAGFRNILFRIHCYAQPRILINLNSFEDSVFDIDSKSKQVIKVWEDRMKEYIRQTYSDIINVDEL